MTNLAAIARDLAIVVGLLTLYAFLFLAGCVALAAAVRLGEWVIHW